MKKFKATNRELVLAVALVLPLFTGCADAQAAQQATAPQATAAILAEPTATANVLPVADDAQRVIPLQGAWNARNFAGLQGMHGPIPATAFVRAADLGRLTAADRDALAAAGVKLDIDLRTTDEERQSHDALADDARFDYQRVSLMGTEKMDMRQMMVNFPDSLGEAYAQWLDGNQAQFKQVFQRIAAQSDGTVLFHCTAGKDRTGVIAGLLLDLAGVPRAHIVHNYAISAHYLEGQPKDSAMNAQLIELMRQHPEIARKMAGMGGTAPENMEIFLDALYQRYGGAAGYLKAIGLSDVEIHSLQVRLGQAGWHANSTKQLLPDLATADPITLRQCQVLPVRQHACVSTTSSIPVELTGNAQGTITASLGKPHPKASGRPTDRQRTRQHHCRGRYYLHRALVHRWSTATHAKWTDCHQ